MGSEIDKRNFRKGILKDGRIEPTEHFTSGGAHPPAKMYQYRDNNLR